MTTPGFAIPNILGTLSLGPAHLAVDRPAKTGEKQSRHRRRKLALAKGSKMLRKVKSIVNVTKKKDQDSASKIESTPSETSEGKQKAKTSKRQGSNGSTKILTGPWPSRGDIMAATKNDDESAIDADEQTIGSMSTEHAIVGQALPVALSSPQQLLHPITTDPPFDSQSDFTTQLHNPGSELRNLDNLISWTTSLLSFGPIRGRARNLNGNAIDESRSITAVAETRTHPTSTILPGKSNKHEEDQIRKECPEQETDNSNLPLITPKQSACRSKKSKKTAEETANHENANSKRDSLRNTFGASQQNNVSKEKALQSNKTDLTISLPDPVSQIPELEGDTVKPPAIPKKSARRTLNLKRTGVIDGMQYPYVGGSIAQPSSCDASSVYSRDTTASSTVFGSNFHYDEPNVLPLNFEVKSRADATTHSLSGDHEFSVEPDPFVDRTESNEQQMDPTPWLSQDFHESWQRKLHSEHRNDSEHKLATCSSSERAVPILQAKDSGIAGNRRRAFINAHSTTTSPDCPVNTRHAHHSNDPTSPTPPRRALFATCSAQNPHWIPPLNPFDALVYIVVGGTLRLRLPCHLLTTNSPFLRNIIDVTCPTAKRETIRFPSTQPRIFEVWLRWIYAPDTRGISWREVRASVEELLEAWRFGKIVLDGAFRDACVDRVVEVARELESPPVECVKGVFEITEEGEGLRRLFVAMMCEEGLPEEWGKDERVAMERLGRCAWQEYWKERKINGKVRDRIRNGEEGYPSWKEGGCRFHEHGDTQRAS